MSTKWSGLLNSTLYKLILSLAISGVLVGTGAFSPYVQPSLTASAQGATAPSAHYIVFERHADGTIMPAYSQIVEADLALQSLTNQQLSDALSTFSRNSEQIAITLQASDGRTVYQNVIPVSPWLRGEFEGETPESPIDGHLIPLDTASFVVRVPQIEGTTLTLRNNRLETIARFDTEKLSSSTPRIRPEPLMQISAATTITGPASNRVDLLVLGDGYTDSQSAKFDNDAAAVISQFFSISPYAEYINYYNIHTLFTPSNQPGADHPPYNPSCGGDNPTCCSDPAMQYDSRQGMMVDTVFDSRFCSFGIHRLLVTNYSKVLAAAAAVPDWDTLLVIVNDPTYGGSGASDLAVISIQSNAVSIAQHEYGHSFIGLADEYDTPYPGYPSCSDLPGSSSPCEANVTNVTARAQIKWTPWINAGTSIPTPNDPAYSNVVGLFQGARYLTVGMYRPGYSCLMRVLYAPFCPVASQAYVLRLYHGKGSMPGISLIDPGSTSPADPALALAHPASQVFHASILSPAGGPAAQVTWLENGIPIPGANSHTYTYTTNPNSLGSQVITLRVKDVTPLVHPAMAGNALEDEYSWTVNVSLFTDVPVAYWAADWISRLYRAQITSGCTSSPLQYCPEATVTRAQMAVFLERAIHGASYSPPEVGIGTGFEDVPAAYWSAPYIKQLVTESITVGCGNGNYCPEQPVTRAQMAVFLLRAKYGGSYLPPDVGAGTGFADVSPGYWAAAWIKQLVAEGITSGCGNGNYCPDAPVTRAQMAVFLVTTFSLP